MSRRSSSARRRIGRVSIYEHHGSWYCYYQNCDRAVRRRVGSEAQAEVEASLLNAQLVAAQAGLTIPAGVSTRGSTAADDHPSITFERLRDEFLHHHEHVLHSSLATVSRYRSATKHLLNFASDAGAVDCGTINVADFVQYLRRIEISPNGHPKSRKRRLREKGIRFILECCRSMYHFGIRQRRFADNPFTQFGIGKLKVRDSQPIFVFDPNQELAFLHAADGWGFPIHFVQAKTGIRSGELAHLLIEDIDLDAGWLYVHGKPELGWNLKAGHERRVPLLDEVVTVLRRLLGGREQGAVFCRTRFTQSPSSLLGSRTALAREAAARLESRKQHLGRSLSRKEEKQVLKTIWRDAGAVDEDRIRTSFIQTAKAAGLDATCPKSWRHTFATLLQQANVDLLVRQETLGHKPSSPSLSALGMTGVYTHTTPEFQRSEIERALRLRPESLALGTKYPTDFTR